MTARVVVPTRPMRLACALGHEWDTTMTVVDRGIQRREGRRPQRHFEHVADVDRCPTCGHRWQRGVPASQG